jgi:hypothetical protein
MCSLAIAWSVGILYLLNAIHSTVIPQGVNNAISLPLFSDKEHKSIRLRASSSTINNSLQNHPFQLQSTSTWTWPIIHIVSTRFMQGQGHLLSLGRSRLKLLEVVCLPSILKQTLLQKDTLINVYNHTRWNEPVSKLTEEELMTNVDPLFLWIIKVDPDLDPRLLEELNAVLEPVKHFAFVVGSNINYGIGIKPGGWRDGQSGRDVLDAFRDGRVYFPREGQSAFQRISRAYNARLDRVVLETRLDADDAINIDYFSVLHYTALKDLVRYQESEFVSNDDEFEQTTDDDSVPEQQQKEAHETAKWIYWCPHRHIQWNPSTSFYDPNNDPGMLSVFESPSICVTPGLTLGFAVGTNESDVPRYEHTRVYGEIRNGNFQLGDGKQQDCGLHPTTRCAVFVENPFVSAFRSRAMTSAGKMHLLVSLAFNLNQIPISCLLHNLCLLGMHMMEALGKPSMETPDYYTEVSDKLWKTKIQEYFGIVPSQAKEAADFLMDIYVDTVRDNLRGQCTKGHSCKISSLEKLQMTIDILEEKAGGMDVGGV